jgi:hypothetical protein
MVPAIAMNVVEGAPAGTVIEAAGTGSSALSLLRLTAVPPPAAALESRTVQVLEAADPRLVGEQVREERVTGATRLMEAVCETLLSVAVTVAV